MSKNPEPSSVAAFNRMRAVRTKDTAPEKAIRLLLYRSGLRYRVNVQPVRNLNRRADIVFRSVKVAVFVDGCFWHGCPKHGTQAKANAEFWRKKIERNKERDAETNRLLKRAGWKVIRVWEHENPQQAAKKICKVIQNQLSRTR